MKSYKILLLALSCLSVAACGPKSVIDFSAPQAPESSFVVRQLDVNVYRSLDTVKTDAAGHFSYKVKLEKDQPEFVYVFYNNVKVASLLLEGGQKAVVEADTLGNYSVSGSTGSEKLCEIEKIQSEFLSRMVELSNTAEDPSLPSSARIAIQKEMSSLYVKHYRQSVSYVLSNPYSLTIIPVLYEKLGENSSVFSQPTDALHFQNAYDSLKTVFPKSKYVEALGREAKRRMGEMNMAVKLQDAKLESFPNISMPDQNGVKKNLDEVDSKVILVHFWTAKDRTQTMFNQDVLEPLYGKYHSKGLEIYSVCVDPDKASWAEIVRNQALPWINVNDGLGSDSRYLALYNIQSLPSTVIISGGEIVKAGASDKTAIESFLGNTLK